LWVLTRHFSNPKTCTEKLFELESKETVKKRKGGGGGRKNETKRKKTTIGNSRKAMVWEDAYVFHYS